MAPRAAQAAHGRDGIRRWTTTAMTIVVNSTAPIARDAIPKTCRFRRSTAIDHAPSVIEAVVQALADWAQPFTPSSGVVDESAPPNAHV